MAAFGQDLLNGFFSDANVRDYRHASKTFRSAGYELAPRQKFLFHVYFTLNTSQIPTLRQAFGVNEKSQLSLLIKNVQLPRFEIDTETLNQYNRKRIIQKKINYQPVQLTMHDDGSDLARKLWYAYYSYYYKDPSQTYNGLPTTNGSAGATTTPSGFDYNGRDIYDGARAVNDWGLIGESFIDATTGTSSGKPPFFRDITIYGLCQKKFASYVLINPVIENFEHDTYDYSDGRGIMENRMTIRYETVKYTNGVIGGRRGSQVPGFADPAHYDTQSSPLANPGTSATFLGQGGILAAGVGITNDLQRAASGDLMGVIGAVQKAGALNRTVQKAGGIKAVARQSVIDSAKEVIQNGTLESVIRSTAGRGGPNSTTIPVPPSRTVSNTSVGTTPLYNVPPF